MGEEKDEAKMDLLLTVLQIPAEVAEVVESTAIPPVPAVQALCVSGCTRKHNNKLKGERLCTTL